MSNIVPFITAPAKFDAVQDLEIALLSILINYPQRIDEIAPILKPEAFCFLAHRQIYDAVFAGYRQNRSFDVRTLALHFGAGSFSGIGIEMRTYIFDIGSSLAIPQFAKDYARSVMAEWFKRCVVATLSETSSENEKAEKIAKLWQERESGDRSDLSSLDEALESARAKTEVLYKNGGGYAGIPSGINDLDNLLCGFEKSGLYVLAGRPAMGKSALGLTIAMNMARAGNPILFFSLEMSTEQIAHRVFARYAPEPIWNQRTGRDVDFVALETAKQFLKNVPLFIIDKGGVSADWICSKSLEFSRKKKPSLIVVDHLGIVAARDSRTNRVNQVAEMTATFKALAKQADCPVLLLHQLNRGVEGREDKRPTLSDLRDSGSVEQDADAVMLIYREEYYLKNKEPKSAEEISAWQEKIANAQGKAEILIEKNRQGKTGRVLLHFDGERQFFEGTA